MDKNKKNTQLTCSKIPLLAALICLAGFFAVLALLYAGRLSAFDTSVAGFFYALRRPRLTQILTAVTYFGNWQTIIVLNIAMLLIPLTCRSFGVPGSLAALISHMINRFVKYRVLRARPDKTLHLISQGGYSFPSGHAMTGISFYGTLAYCLLRTAKKNGKYAVPCRILAAALCLLIVLIGLSRIYLGVHYPSDVLAGWLLGGTFLATFVYILNRFGGFLQ